VLLVAFSLVAAEAAKPQLMHQLQLQQLLQKQSLSKTLAHLATSTPRLNKSGALSRKPVTI
jgi:hypothetical protein